MKLEIHWQAPETWAARMTICEPPGEVVWKKTLPNGSLPGAGFTSGDSPDGTSTGVTPRDCAQLELARQRLVMRLLDEVSDAAAHHLVLKAGSEAATLAAAFPYPLLVFPTLFHEAAAASLEAERQRAQAYWRRLAVTEL